MPILADTQWNFGDFLLATLYVFGFVIFFWLLITVFADLFRRHDVHGFGKFLWIIFVIFLPFIGIFVYIITQSHGMAERNQKESEAAVQQLRQTVGYSAADEIAKLDALREQGKLSDAEYQQLRSKVVGA